jgi:hypothetical protein
MEAQATYLAWRKQVARELVSAQTLCTKEKESK